MGTSITENTECDEFNKFFFGFSVFGLVIKTSILSNALKILFFFISVSLMFISDGTSLLRFSVTSVLSVVNPLFSSLYLSWLNLLPRCF